MKKFFAFFLAIALALPLVGCCKKETAADKAADAINEAAADAEKAVDNAVEAIQK